MKKYLCTHCLNSFDSYNVLLECDDRKNKHKFAKKSINKQTRFFYGRKIYSSSFPTLEKCFCPVCKTKLDRFLCPSCQTEIASLEDLSIIAVAGSKNSGKTVYLSTLFKLLLDNYKDETTHLTTLFSKKFNIRVEPASGEMEKRLNNYIIKAGMSLPGTTSSNFQEPIVLKLTNYKTNKVKYLAFYDTAGDNFNYGDSKYNANIKQLSKADMIIFLADPFTITEIRQKSEISHLFNGKQIFQHPRQVLTILSAEFGCINFKRSRQIKIPMAFCLSKCDILRPIAPDLMLNNNLMEKGLYVEETINSSSTRLKRFLYDYGQDQLLDYFLKPYSDVKFFPLSSLGESPVNQVAEIYNPRNVLDPVLWFLAKEKFINTKKV